MAAKNGKKSKFSQKSPHSIDDVSNFTLPIAMECSHVEFPVLKHKKRIASWATILQKSENESNAIRTYVENKRPKEIKAPFLKTEIEYVQKEIFPCLLPALAELLFKAQIWDTLKNQKCFFNGIDFLAQELWNANPRFKFRKDNNLHIFNMVWVRQFLKNNPRPYYPKSWLWTDDYAATIIQKTVRQFFVQREPEVQEMRVFWKKLEIESKTPELAENPLFAKKFVMEPLK